MPEIKKPVKSIRIDYMCDVCKKGYMSPNGELLTMDPPHYWHKCKSCGTEQALVKSYPCIEWETIQ